MYDLDHCPMCESRDLLALDLHNDLTEEDLARPDVVLLKNPGYALCQRCELVFVRRRQTPEEVAANYSDYKFLAKREYAVYPPPPKFIDAQSLFAEQDRNGSSEQLLTGAVIESHSSVPSSAPHTSEVHRFDCRWGSGKTVPGWHVVAAGQSPSPKQGRSGSPSQKPQWQ